ncbi:hypothetical protein FAF44_47275 [Nonomuraea sp. MG754425]|uniref:hypothetical protein n=1 Tax=Nonomuraea sp. MG754425 TaxID=2570319 RepID=UPI001F20DA27|nr:hypothetical protein [Nonomuraea sp. MG754425]MCF6475891.1 hypothetical protein [Nonomuraea sp. MG754425]
MFPLWAAALWGMVGGLCVEGLELHARIRRARSWSWRRPIPQGLSAYVTSVVIRVGIGAALAAAGSQSGQIQGAFAALGLGVAAPLVVEKVARLFVAAIEPEPARTAPAVEEAGADVT